MRLAMVSKFYSILPKCLKRILIWIFKSFRKVLFLISNSSIYKTCIAKETNLNRYKSFQMSRRYGPLKHLCYAPHTSMFFSLHGKMSPCYATYNQDSDVYGETTIRDSWFNGSFETIRFEHKKCDLDSSCSFCNQLLIKGAYGSMLMQKYEHYAFSRSKYPAIMEFELSNRCNLECIMCDNNLSSSKRLKDGQKLHKDNLYGRQFLEELKEFIPYLKMAEFTGGDPFLIEIYYEIWDMIIKMNPNCEILITTNANTMNSRMLSLMEKTNKLNFNISIDSVNKELYESIRINGNFEKAIENIQIFNNYVKKNKTGMNLLVCPLNVNSRDLPNIVSFGNSLDVGVFFHTVVKPKHLSLKFESSEQLDKLVSYLETFSFPQKTWTQRINSQNYQNLIELIKTWEKENLLRENKVIFESDPKLILRKIRENLHDDIYNKLIGFLSIYENHCNYNKLLLKILNIGASQIENHINNDSYDTIIEHFERMLSNN
jgi:molybdenum cofactor biosynthesis enzyme MoaA